MAMGGYAGYFQSSSLGGAALYATNSNAGGYALQVSGSSYLTGNATTTGSLQVQDIATLATTTMRYGSKIGTANGDDYLTIEQWDWNAGGFGTIPLIKFNSPTFNPGSGQADYGAVADALVIQETGEENRTLDLKFVSIDLQNTADIYYTTSTDTISFDDAATILMKVDNSNEKVRIGSNSNYIDIYNRNTSFGNYISFLPYTLDVGATYWETQGGFIITEGTSSPSLSYDGSPTLQFAPSDLSSGAIIRYNTTSKELQIDGYNGFATSTFGSDLKLGTDRDLVLTNFGSIYLDSSGGISLGGEYRTTWPGANNLFDQWLDTTSSPQFNNLAITGTATSTFAGDVQIANGYDLQVSRIYSYSPLTINADVIITGETTFNSPLSIQGLSALNATTTNIDTLTVNTSLSGTGFDTAWDDKFAATTTWAAFTDLWNSEFNATTTWAGFQNLFEIAYNATTTQAGFADQFAQYYNATTTLNGFTNNSVNWDLAYSWGNWATGALAQSDYYATTTWAGGNNDLIVTGNATTTGHLVIGTTDPADFEFGVGDLFIGGNATSTGNLTVGTSTLVVLHDPAGTGDDRVGIGTNAPAKTLHVKNNDGGTETMIRIEASNYPVLEFYDDYASNPNTDNMWQIISNSSNGALQFRDADTSAETVMTLMYDGNVGIGDTSPAQLFTVGNGDKFTVDGSGNVTTTNSLTSLINTTGSQGQIKITSMSGLSTYPGLNNLYGLEWTDSVGQVGHIGLTYDGTYTNMYFGGFYNGGYKTWSDQLMTIKGNGYVGIGTATPVQKLHLSGTTNVGDAVLVEFTKTNVTPTGAELGSYQFGYNSGVNQVVTGKISSKDYNTGGSGWFDVTSRYNAGLSFYTMAAASLAEQLTITYDGNVGIGTTTPWAGYKLAVNGDIISSSLGVNRAALGGITLNSTVDPAYVIQSSGSTRGYLAAPTVAGHFSNLVSTGQELLLISYENLLLTASSSIKFGTGTGIGSGVHTERMTISPAGNVGIGTTSPFYLLSVNASNNPAADATLFVVSTSTDAVTTPNIKFKVMADGGYYSDGALRSGHADYAEYFKTKDQDLVPGETVCIDIVNNDAVERCTQGADSNVIGIVSTNPAVIGNAPDDEKRGSDYTIVALLGQIPGYVSAENGEIRPGDSLTSASIPGYLMKANAGDSTVGIALEPLDAGQGTINVLISRKNKSLTVEQVEGKITQHIADMEIEDEVNLLVANAVDNLNLDEEINGAIDPKLLLLESKLTVTTDALGSRIDSLNYLTTDLLSTVNDNDLRLTTLENAVTTFTEFTSSTQATLLGLGTKISDLENNQTNFSEQLNTVQQDLANASSTIAALQGQISDLYSLLENFQANATTTELTVDPANLDIQTLVVGQAATFYGTMTVMGEAGFEYKVVFKQDIEVQGKIYASSDQAGTVTIPANATSTEIIFATEYETIPKIAANLKGSNDSPIFVNWLISDQTNKGFRIIISQTQTTDLSFDWIALAVKNNESQPIADGTVIDPVTETPPTEPAIEPVVILGCTDQTAINYNSQATQDDGSCQFEQASNTTPTEDSTTQTPTLPDESVTEPLTVLGCTDQIATNYNPLANQDDSSCTYPEQTITQNPDTQDTTGEEWIVEKTTLP
ncbi:MAG: hypothetical protein WC508_05805 [Patescibacteria group bacterium]